MVGSNLIVINKATVLAALNYYFKEVLFQDGMVPTATGISEVNTGADANSFRVSTTTEPAE